MEVYVFYSLFAGTDGERTEFILWCLATVEGNIHKLSVLLALLWPEEQAFVADYRVCTASVSEVLALQLQASGVGDQKKAKRITTVFPLRSCVPSISAFFSPPLRVY